MKSKKTIWNATWMYVLVGTLIGVSAILFFSVMKPLELFTSYPKPSLEYFYLENCPHCKDFSPIWDDAVKMVNDDPSVKDKISMLKHNINDEAGNGAKKAKQYNVQAAPTILYIYGSDATEYSEYNGPRTADGILAYIKATLSTSR
jgi:thiol-disulfide isomerase/thioredoxin